MITKTKKCPFLFTEVSVM